jgi:hypothetical protein
MNYSTSSNCDRRQNTIMVMEGEKVRICEIPNASTHVIVVAVDHQKIVSIWVKLRVLYEISGTSDRKDSELNKGTVIPASLLRYGRNATSTRVPRRRSRPRKPKQKEEEGL